MGHTSITLGLLFGLASLVSQLQPASVEPRDPPAVPAAQPDALQDATAAAVIETLRSRFAGNDVEFRFDSFSTEQASERDLEVRGAGQFRLDGGNAWLPMHYSALYDTATASIANPEISFAASSSPRMEMTVDTAALDLLVKRKLTEEFASQAVGFDLGTVHTVAGNNRYATVKGLGIATFAGEGTAAVVVQAIFDRSSGRWLGVTYELGNEAA